MQGRESHYRYSWHPDNHIELLVDGERFFPAMLQAIHTASLHILLEFYLFESGRIADRLIRALSLAAQRGVQVYLLLDDFGARKLSRHDREQLSRAGIALQYYNPLRYGQLRRNLFRDHRKLLLIDSTQVFTGGAGITDEFDTANQPLGWHDVMLHIRGPVVADWQDLFSRNWERLAGMPLALSPVTILARHPPGLRARLTINAPTRMELKRSLLKRIRLAEQRLWIATAYFLPSWKIRRQLRKAAERGVDVRLLLPGKHTDHPAVRHAGRRYYASLLRHGVRIFEFQPRFLHAKILLCDHWVSIGSSNIDRWNMRWNLEANQEIDDAVFAQQLSELFEQDFTNSREMQYQRWQLRPWYRRLQERFWGAVARWLDRFTQR